MSLLGRGAERRQKQKAVSVFFFFFFLAKVHLLVGAGQAEAVDPANTSSTTALPLLEAGSSNRDDARTSRQLLQRWVDSKVL